jgi:DNA adenine methylase
LYGGVSFEVIFLNPIIPYAGGKKLELPFILPLVPKNFNTYFEPFFGGGALFFALQPEFSVISDTFPELVNFYNCCKVDPFKILSFLEIIHYKYIIAADNDSVFYSKTFFQYRKSLYYDILHQFSSLSDDFQKAAYFYFISKNSNFALFRKNKIGLFNNSFKFQNNNNFFLSFKNYAPFFHNLFQNSQIFCHSYQHSLNLASSLDFVFLDPPYNNNDSNIYLNNYIDFVLLKQDFLNCSAKTLVSLPSTPQIIHLFGSFVKFSYSKKYFLRNQKSATHLIVSNF